MLVENIRNAIKKFKRNKIKFAHIIFPFHEVHTIHTR